MTQVINEYHPELSNPIGFADNLDKELPQLIAYLNGNANCNNFAEIVKFLFGPDSVLKCLSNDTLDVKFLKPTLSSLQNTFSTNLNNVLQILENSDDFCEEVYYNLSEILQVCLDILGGYYDILDHLRSSSSVLCKDVKSLIKTLPGILLEAFSHCQGSENNYGSYFTTASEILSSFFRKSYDIASLFYKILDEQITFDCLIEKDVGLLVTVLEILCSMGEIVVSLDMKTLVDQWKGLAKLLTKYASYLKDRLNVAQPIKFLIECLEKSIAAVIEEQDAKLRSRNLKLGSFILKIIVKLSEIYGGYLDSCIYDLFKLLLLLNRCSRMTENSCNEELDRFIVVGAGPLLSHLAKDRQFVELFQKTLESEELNTTEEIIGFFYTHLRLFKYLVNSTDTEVKCTWLKLPLVQSAINLFSKVCQEVDLSTKVDERDTYTALISVTVAFVVSNFSAGQFVVLEEHLYARLFSCDIQVGILASDLLTLISRLSSEDVCLRGTRYLLGLVGQTGGYSLRPEISLARATGARLYSLLSRTGRDSVEREFPYAVRLVSQPPVPSETLAPLTPVITTTDVSSPKEFVDMLEDLYMRCRSLPTCDSLVPESLLQTYHEVLMGFSLSTESSDHQPDWWYNILRILSKCFHHIAVYLDEDNLQQVFDNFSKLTAMGQPSTSYYISGLVAEICTKKPPLSISQDIINNALLTFKLCFLTKNVLIKQMVAEKFVLIDNSITCDILHQMDKDVQKYVSNYSKKILSQSINNYFNSFNISFTHKCSKYNYEKITSPPNKKFKPDTGVPSISANILKLKENVDTLAIYFKENPLSANERQIVHKIICTLENL